MLASVAGAIRSGGRKARSRVKVVFDAYWWVQGPASLRHVLRETVLAWHAEFPDDDLALVVRRRHLDRARASAPAGVVLVPTTVRPQALLASLVTERVRRRLRYDAVLVHNFAPRSRGVSAVYLHDVLFVTNPEWFTRTELAYFSLMVRWAPRADVVFSSSATEGHRIRAHTRARAVVPVGLGLSTELTQGHQRRPVPGLVTRQFVLTVGRLNVRKNLEATILGCLASGAVDPTHPLVVVGGAGGKGEVLNHAVEAAVADGSVRFLGHIDEPELRWLYSHATVFVCLSLGEGFGMPPIEASFFGTPVVASDLPVFRENLRDGVDFVDPTDVEAIQATVRRAVSAAAEGSPQNSEVVASQHDWRSSVRRIREAMADRLVAPAARHPAAPARHRPRQPGRR